LIARPRDIRLLLSMESLGEIDGPTTALLSVVGRTESAGGHVSSTTGLVASSQKTASQRFASFAGCQWLLGATAS